MPTAQEATTPATTAPVTTPPATTTHHTAKTPHLITPPQPIPSNSAHTESENTIHKNYTKLYRKSNNSGKLHHHRSLYGIRLRICHRLS